VVIHLLYDGVLLVLVKTVVITAILMMMVYVATFQHGYNRFLFRWKANCLGVPKEMCQLIEELIARYRPQDPYKMLLNSRTLNKCLMRGISDLDLDLSLSLTEREGKQFKFYEVKRFFDRVELSSTLHSTVELAVQSRLVINSPHNVRQESEVELSENDRRGFKIILRALDSGMGQGLKVQIGQELECLYCDDQALEHFFMTKVKAVDHYPDQSIITCAHSHQIQLVVKTQHPQKRINSEAFLASAELVLDKASGTRRFQSASEEACRLIDISLGSAVVRSVVAYNMQSFVALTFVGKGYRLLSYGRVVQVLAFPEYYQVHIQFVQTSRAVLNQMSEIIYDL
jgi:hypothetical protein